MRIRHARHAAIDGWWLATFAVHQWPDRIHGDGQSSVTVDPKSNCHSLRVCHLLRWESLAAVKKGEGEG